MECSFDKGQSKVEKSKKYAKKYCNRNFCMACEFLQTTKPIIEYKNFFASVNQIIIFIFMLIIIIIVVTF